MKKTFDCSLLYSDTDSLLYEIRGCDFYKKVASDNVLKANFDFSNYPVDNPLHDNSNKMVTLKFKDEMGGKIIKEFIGLKPKMYSIAYENKQKMSAKGVSRFAQTSLKHGIYKNVLESGLYTRSYNTRIGSSKHLLQTIRSNKIALSAFDDKRYIENDGIHCLPFGHHDIRDVQIEREILEDSTWGVEEPQLTPNTSPTWSTIIREFRVAPSSNVPSLDGGQPEDEENDHQADPEMLNDLFTPPDPGMHQRVYTESELDEVFDFDEITTPYSTPRQRNPFINDEAEEEHIDANSNSSTINSNPLNDISPRSPSLFDDTFNANSNSSTIMYPLNDLSPRSPSLFEPPAPKRRRVILISSDSD